MKYNVEIHYENQAVLRFVQEIEGHVDEWVWAALDNKYFLCRDVLTSKFIVCCSDKITGILIEEYSEVKDDQRACLDDYRTDKPSTAGVPMPESQPAWDEGA